MPRLAAAIAMVIATAAAANAQEAADGAVQSFTIGELAGQGYEIKAAAQNGSRYVIFMQNEKSAYACEFVNVTTTRCRQIN